MQTTGADTVLRILGEEGVEAIFGYPGANTLPLYDRLIDHPIRHYLMRHEQAAAHAADGYARATGKVGVCVSTSGPGATNLVTGIAAAFMDSTPLVALTAQVSTPLLGRDAFQETDIMGITLPITKHSFRVMQPQQLAATLRQAFRLARSGRPGPILVDLPKDILESPCPEDAASVNGVVHEPERETDGKEPLEQIARALNRSERPVLLLGGGVKLGDASREVAAFIEKTGIPFVTTLMGIGAVPSANGYNLGFVGTHGNELANRVIHQADFILAVGTRFTDRTTSLIEEFAPLATIAQIDIDPTSIGKNVHVHLPCIADIREALAELATLVQETDRAAWDARIAGERAQAGNGQAEGGCGEAGRLIALIRDAMPEDTTVVTDVGLNQIWTIRTWQPRFPRGLITSGGMGAMGFGLPAAIGAKIGAPDREVVAICGDGGFFMNIQELATLSHYRLPVKIVVINNGHLGMIRQLQDLFYQSRFSGCDLGSTVDLVAVAQGFGVPASRLPVGADPAEAIAALRSAQGPYLLEAFVEPDNYVYPIIRPGCANIEMICGK